ncbi:MAG: hypothetical protein IT373_29505 [Polyangiaceae bacterium]|nr:hypothetical protein [Polyangiaceae bacterium]
MKSTPKSAQKPQTKSDFILAHPNVPAKDIVAKAKSAGFALTEKYVYTIRSVARSRQQRASLRAAAPTGKSGAESLLVAVAAEVGLARAISLLEAERQKVLAMLGK